jgi:dihydrolipoamide dehydrogenase
MQEQDYDIVVVGSGTSGRTVSLRLTKHGFSVALVEPELVGGDCHYWASVLRRQPLK